MPGVRRYTDGDDAVVGLDVIINDCELLVVTENGLARHSVSEYRRTGRGGKGIKTLNMTDKTGPILGFSYARIQRDNDYFSGRHHD